MPTTRVSPKHQITIPKPVFDQAQLEPGDLLDAHMENGKIILTPKRLADKTPAVKFSSREQKILDRAKAKIDKINTQLLNSKGLTHAEIEIAAKAGLIDSDQAYFWTEKCQAGEREVERDIRAGCLSPAAHNSDELMEQLRELKRS